jgi:hypothetical protein
VVRPRFFHVPAQQRHVLHVGPEHDVDGVAQETEKAVGGDALRYRNWTIIATFLSLGFKPWSRSL